MYAHKTIKAIAFVNFAMLFFRQGYKRLSQSEGNRSDEIPSKKTKPDESMTKVAESVSKTDESTSTPNQSPPHTPSRVSPRKPCQ